MLNCFVKKFLGNFLRQFATFSVDFGYKLPKLVATLVSVVVKSTMVKSVNHMFV